MKPVFESSGVSMYKGDSRELLPNLPDESVHCCVTSPPYWGLRDYGVSGQIGLESTPYEYISTMRMLFAEVRRVLRSDGTLWLNMGDSYCGSSSEHKDIGSFGKNSCISKKTQTGVPMNGRGERTRGMSKNGLKPKDLVGIPWMLAFALREDGWYLRQDIIWAKPNPMPESVTDRCTKSHEYIFLLSKSERYYFNQEAILEPASWNTHARKARASVDHKSMPTERRNGIRPASWNGSSFDSGKTGQMKRTHGGTRPAGCGPKTSAAGSGVRYNESFSAAVTEVVDQRNKRSVWEVTTQPFPEAHFATFPEDLIKPCILAGCPEGGTVLDPFGGAGTTGLVARKLHCKAILLELNSEYIEISEKRLQQEVFQFGEAKAL